MDEKANGPRVVDVTIEDVKVAIRFNYILRHCEGSCWPDLLPGQIADAFGLRPWFEGRRAAWDEQIADLLSRVQ